ASSPPRPRGRWRRAAPPRSDRAAGREAPRRSSRGRRGGRWRLRWGPTPPLVGDLALVDRIPASRGELGAVRSQAGEDVPLAHRHGPAEIEDLRLTLKVE